MDKGGIDCDHESERRMHVAAALRREELAIKKASKEYPNEYNCMWQKKHVWAKVRAAKQLSAGKSQQRARSSVC
jgi:hypothetical protein